MAEFSKQYCEQHMPDFPHDFDIEEIAKDLPNDHYTPIICEGFGFIAIGKNDEGQTVLAFREGGEIVWKKYESLCKLEL